MPSITSPKPKGRGACPTFFVACCQEAAQGGANGYAIAGRTLAGHLQDLNPYRPDEVGWKTELRHLENLLYPPRPEGWRLLNPDDDRVWEWFERNLPRCTALIPRRRRDRFVDGVYEAVCVDELQFPE
jgi:hypothetical protein